MTLLGGLLRYRLAVGTIAAIALGWFDALARLTPVDHVLFSDAAGRLLSDRWASAFVDKRVQVGPLYLAVLGAVRNLVQALGITPRDVLCIAIEVAVTVGVMLTVRAVVRGHAWSPALELAAGVVTLAGGLAWTGWASGHPEEVAIGLIWIYSARLARDERTLGAGLLLALAAGLKLWGALGIPILLLATDPRRRVLAALSFTVLVAATYAPFLLFGEVNTFDFRWPVDSPLLRPFVGDDRLFPWPLRILQGAVTVGLGGMVAVRMRSKEHVEWVLPLAIVLIRIVLDPLPHYYFWLPIEAIGIVGAAALATTRSLTVAVAAGIGVYVMLAWRFMPLQFGFFYRVALSVGLLAVAMQGVRPPRTQIQHHV